jgi:hypothetical protein
MPHDGLHVTRIGTNFRGSLVFESNEVACKSSGIIEGIVGSRVANAEETSHSMFGRKRR